MGFTLLLLGALYVVFIAVLVAAGVGAIAVAVSAVALFLVQYFASQRLALTALGTREVGAHEAPALHAIVERLCIRADLPMPRLGIVDTPMPNAFAVGRTQSSATVCATTGLLELLDERELEGVLAHELTHVAGFDAMVMTITGFFASIAGLIGRLGLLLGARSGDEDEDEGPGFFAVVIISGLVYVVSFVLNQALSRHREFAADRGAALITGRPGALSAALLTISGRMEQIPQRDLRAACGEMAAFYIISPSLRSSVATLFSTHPPLEARLAALARLEAQLPATA